MEEHLYDVNLWGRSFQAEDEGRAEPLWQHQTGHVYRLAAELGKKAVLERGQGGQKCHDVTRFRRITLTAVFKHK